MSDALQAHGPGGLYKSALLQKFSMGLVSFLLGWPTNESFKATVEVVVCSGQCYNKLSHNPPKWSCAQARGYVAGFYMAYE